MKSVITFAALVLFVLTAAPALGQEYVPPTRTAAHKDEITPPRVVYYSTLHDKPLPWGTRVWTNFGDSECAYPGSYHPNISIDCLPHFEKAIITGIERWSWTAGSDKIWLYEISIDPHGTEGTFSYKAAFDDLREIIGHAPEWQSWSPYILVTNW